MEERGLGDRLESGLHLRNAISESGKLIIIRYTNEKIRGVRFPHFKTTKN
jgi:hypothetical protein